MRIVLKLPLAALLANHAITIAGAAAKRLNLRAAMQTYRIKWLAATADSCQWHDCGGQSAENDFRRVGGI